MSNIVLPLMYFTFLGQTMDIKNYHFNYNSRVFNYSLYDEVPLNEFEAKYFVLRHDDPHEFLNVPVDIALQVKSRYMSLVNEGMVHAIRDPIDVINPVTFVAIAIQRTMEKVLKKDIQQASNWKNMIREGHTHYIDSEIYGNIAVFIREFSPTTPRYADDVMNIFTSAFGTSGNLTDITKEKWNKVMDDIYRNSDLIGGVGFSSFLSVTVISGSLMSPNIDSLKNMANLPQFVNDRATRLYVKLKPLQELDESFPTLETSPAVIDKFDMVDKMYNDATVTYKSMKKWLHYGSDDYTEERYNRLKAAFEPVTKVMATFDNVVSNASFYGTTEHELNTVIQVYMDNLPEDISTYYMLYRRVREDLAAICKDSFRDPANGTLSVKPEELIFDGTVEDLEECKQECLTNERCRAIGYDEETKECQLYSRSTKTAEFVASDSAGVVYDKHCY